jgi:hypothetical protein
MSMRCARRCTGLRCPNLTGGTAKMLPNHHLTKPVLIGEIRADGQFDIISQTEPVAGDAWTDFLPESAVLEADWPGLGCGMYNTADQDLRAAQVELLSGIAGAAPWPPCPLLWKVRPAGQTPMRRLLLCSPQRSFSRWPPRAADLAAASWPKPRR